VSSYLTVSPLPPVKAAVCSLWHWSVGSPPLAVSQHPALRSPDFPPARNARAGDHPAFSDAIKERVSLPASIAYAAAGCRVGTGVSPKISTFTPGEW